MKLEDLKELEKRATKAPWSSMSLNGNACVDAEVLPGYVGTILKGSSEHDGRLSSVLRNLAPEIIPLWQSVNLLCYPPPDCPATCLSQLTVVRENLDWLNSKLADLG